jgi:hypothetical protein
MTTPNIPPHLELGGGAPALDRALQSAFAAARSGAVELPAEVLSQVTALAAIDEQLGELPVRPFSSGTDPRFEAVTTAARQVAKAARAGNVAADPAASVIAFEQELHRAQTAREVLDRARSFVVGDLRHAFAHGHVGARYQAALDELLERVRPVAATFLAAGVDLADPAALARQPADVLASYGELERAAAQYDRLGAACVELHLAGEGYHASVPQWPLPVRLLGHGIEPARGWNRFHNRPPEPIGQWVWKASRRPIDRLIAAALAPEPEPEPEPDAEVAQDGQSAAPAEALAAEHVTA